MVGEGLGALVLGSEAVAALIVVALVGLEDGVEEALARLDVLVGDVLDCAGGLSEGVLGAFSLFVVVHFGLPGVEVLLALVENHQQLQ